MSACDTYALSILPPARIDPPSCCSLGAGLGQQVRTVDEHGKTVAYDVHVLTRWGVFWAYGGTIFNRKIFALGLTLFAVIVISFTGATITFAMQKPSARVDISNYITLFGKISTLIGFVLGLYQSESVARWRAMRFEQLYGLWGAIHNISLLLGIWLPDDKEEGRDNDDKKDTSTASRQAAPHPTASYRSAEQQTSSSSPPLPASEDNAIIKRTVLRWMLASHALTYFQAINRPSEGLDAAVAEGSLTEDERAILSGVPDWMRAQVLWSWIAEVGQNLASTHRMPQSLTNLPIFLNHCLNARGCIGSIGFYLNNQLPYSYVHLVNWIVKAHLVFISVLYGYTLSAITFNTIYFSTLASVRIYEAIIKALLGGAGVLLNVCFFQGILEIQATLRNPFGDEPDCFPSDADHANMRSGAMSLMGVRAPPQHWFDV